MTITEQQKLEIKEQQNQNNPQRRFSPFGSLRFSQISSRPLSPKKIYKYSEILFFLYQRANDYFFYEYTP